MRELEDYHWFPAFFRKHQMEYLSFLAKHFQIYEPIKTRIENKLSKTAPSVWTDTCSGNGGPVLALNINYETLLTDLYPNQSNSRFPPHIHYFPHPINITKQIPEGDGLITMFNSFHHFSDTDKEKIISRIVSSTCPFLFTEILQPNLKTLFLVFLSTTVGHWLFVPFMRPFSIWRIFFTYLVPLHTLSVFIDGIISVIKSKNSTFYKDLSKKMTIDNYKVIFYQTKGRYAMLNCIDGQPINIFHEIS